MRSRISKLIPPLLLVVSSAVVVAANPVFTFTTLTVMAAVLVIAGAISGIVHRPNGWQGWFLAAVGGAIALEGRAISALTSTELPLARHPLELIGALATVAGLFYVARCKRISRDDQGTLDAAILATAGVGVIWQTAYGASTVVTPGSPVLSLYTPLATVLAAVALARLVFAANRPHSSGRVLASAALSIFGAQLLAVLALPATSPFAGEIPTAALLASWGLFATMLLQPSVVALSEPAMRPRAVISTGRLMCWRWVCWPPVWPPK